MPKHLQIGRSTITKNFNTITISIPSKKNWFMILFLCFWLCGWLMGEVFALTNIFSSDMPIFANAFLLFWVVGWTIGGSFAIITVLWQISGIEKIEIGRGRLIISKSILGYSRNKTFDTRNIEHLQINPSGSSSLNNKKQNTIGLFSWKNGKIQFDYGMKTYRFANSVELAEARKILLTLQESRYLDSKNFSDSEQTSSSKIDF